MPAVQPFFELLPGQAAGGNLVSSDSKDESASCVEESAPWAGTQKFNVVLSRFGQFVVLQGEHVPKMADIAS